jgi:predicted DNA-binding ribbon-helix-helix protein
MRRFSGNVGLEIERDGWPCQTEGPMTIKDPTRSNRRNPPIKIDDGPREQAGAGGHLRSQVTKRSLVVGGHKTSVSLEDAFWIELRSIAHNLGVHLSQLVGSIDSERQHSNLSSAIRLFVFEYRSHAVSGDSLSEQAQAVLAGAKRQTASH